MKRNFVVACALALALVLGLSATVGASVQGSAEPAAKKGAKKGKACKGKAGKGKAGKSAVASAKKKGKSKGCKPKGKAKGDDKAPVAPPAPPAGPPAAAPLSDGTYGDPTTSVELTVSGGATTAVLKYVPPGDCVSINYTSQPVTLTKSGDSWTASETRAFSLVGEPANAKWDLTVKEPGLTYVLNFTLESDTLIGFCKWEGHPTGTLTKVS
ncbi:MAG TPA: hypothetical protein VFI03_13410 [Solirubrobacterales bacterium]|nr:hypothetical protein [Solirubrobacterales bacterium]